MNGTRQIGKGGHPRISGTLRHQLDKLFIVTISQKRHARRFCPLHNRDISSRGVLRLFFHILLLRLFFGGRLGRFFPSLFLFFLDQIHQFQHLFLSGGGSSLLSGSRIILLRDDLTNRLKNFFHCRFLGCGCLDHGFFKSW